MAGSRGILGASGEPERDVRPGVADAPRPAVSLDEAQRLAALLFGVTGPAEELGSQQDRNFRLDAPEGRFLLKVLGSGVRDEDLAIQDEAFDALARAGVQVPRARPGLNGSTIQHATVDDADVRVRLLDYLDGFSLFDSAYLAPAVVTELGRLSAKVARGLQAVESPAPDRGLQWDLRRAGHVVAELVGSVRDSRREAVVAAANDALARLDAVSDALRTQLIHGDITGDNVVCRTDACGRAFPYGVIDFGDLAEGWLVAELAVTVSSLLHHSRSSLTTVLPAVHAFHRILPLTDTEIRALWPLVILRAAVLVVSGEHQVTLEADNEYAADRVDAEWRIFTAATSVDPDAAEIMIRDALGASSASAWSENVAASKNPEPAAFPLIAGLETERCHILDFSVTSPLVDDGAWLDRDVEWVLARAALTAHRVAVAPYGIPRLTRATPLSDVEQATWPTVTDIFVAAGSAVSAPFAAHITVTGLHSILVSGSGDHSDRVLHIDGVTSAVSGSVAQGDAIGVALNQFDGVARLRVQNRSESDVSVAAFVVPSQSVAWRALAPNPEPLLGVTPQQTIPAAASEQQRRAAFFPAAQERYYENPPLIERGWREHLIDTNGRVYLDMVNNVAGVGHSDPRLTSAVAKQLRLLNTNSRFLYRALADLCERLVQCAPSPELDTVLLVNSGTEAVDLAIRLARLYTGRSSIVALREAYHGWSMAADAVTTSAFDNPTALRNRPDWVHVVEAPNRYRGSHRGSDVNRYAREFESEIEALSRSGKPVGAFLCEPILGNAGGVLLPDGYLRSAYDSVRTRGGVCIADEVQVGYGRLGDYFWGAEQQGVVPDIITIAKAMGNGYPLGAVITRRDIAEALQSEGHFFSSAGGSPVSCAAGIAVLDILEQDGLQENARDVGGYLATRLRELAKRHPLIGTVHGLGLYLGVEFVRDRETREPADAETAAMCERLLGLGVIVQPTSERQNVLKIKPPMCLTREDADFFVNRLDEVLSDGW